MRRVTVTINWYYSGCLTSGLARTCPRTSFDEFSKALNKLSSAGVCGAFKCAIASGKMIIDVEDTGYTGLSGRRASH